MNGQADTVNDKTGVSPGSAVPTDHPSRALERVAADRSNDRRSKVRSRFAWRRSRHGFRSGRGSRSRAGSRATATVATAAAAVVRFVEVGFQPIEQAGFRARIATAIVPLELGQERTTEERGTASGLAGVVALRSAGRVALRCRSASGGTGCRLGAGIATSVRPVVTDQRQAGFHLVEDAHAGAGVATRRSGGGAASAVEAGHAGRRHQDESGSHGEKPPGKQGIGIVRGRSGMVRTPNMPNRFGRFPRSPPDGRRENGRVRSLD